MRREGSNIQYVMILNTAQIFVVISVGLAILFTLAYFSAASPSNPTIPTNATKLNAFLGCMNYALSYKAGTYIGPWNENQILEIINNSCTPKGGFPQSNWVCQTEFICLGNSG